MEGYYIVACKEHLGLGVARYDSLKIAHTVLAQMVKEHPEVEAQTWYCVPVANGSVRYYPCGIPK